MFDMFGIISTEREFCSVLPSDRKQTQQSTSNKQRKFLVSAKLVGDLGCSSVLVERLEQTGAGTDESEPSAKGATKKISLRKSSEETAASAQKRKDKERKGGCLS